MIGEGRAFKQERRGAAIVGYATLGRRAHFPRLGQQLGGAQRKIAKHAVGAGTLEGQ